MHMEDLMNYYIRLVPFLGEALGKSFEVAVLDCRTESIVAITNNHISGRSVGAPMTDFAKKMVSSGEWRNRDYIASYSGHTGNNKLLRSSTYFIKSGDTLLGNALHQHGHNRLPADQQSGAYAGWTGDRQSQGCQQ